MEGLNKQIENHKYYNELTYDKLKEVIEYCRLTKSKEPPNFYLITEDGLSITSPAAILFAVFPSSIIILFILIPSGLFAEVCIIYSKHR